MINATLGILIVEVAVVSLVAVSVVVFLFWKHKKRRTAELEQLLQNIENQQGERKAQLAQYLMTDYSQIEDEAQESSEYMVEAEKQFMQLFIKQHIEQAPVSEFYGSLCELLDQYLYFIPKIVAENNNEPSVSTETEVKDIDELEQVERLGEAENTADEIPASELKEDENEEESEPDWGDAFAESGEEMDEEVKDGYEQEQESKNE